MHRHTCTCNQLHVTIATPPGGERGLITRFKYMYMCMYAHACFYNYFYMCSSKHKNVSIRSTCTVYVYIELYLYMYKCMFHLEDTVSGNLSTLLPQ